jgi:hypothetical protein
LIDAPSLRDVIVTEPSATASLKMVTLSLGVYIPKFEHRRAARAGAAKRTVTG